MNRSFSRTTRIAAIGLLAVAGGALAHIARAQDLAVVEVDADPFAPAKSIRLKSPESELAAKWRKAVSELKAAESDEQRAAVRTGLTSLLGEYFDADLKQRESRLEEAEQRIKKLREQLAKRQAAKASIVDLQLKVIENEAAGLGFFAPGLNPTGPDIQLTGVQFPRKSFVWEKARTLSADHYSSDGPDELLEISGDQQSE